MSSKFVLRSLILLSVFASAWTPAQAQETPPNIVDTAPESVLTFAYDPKLVRDKALQGQFLPVKMAKKPISLNALYSLRNNSIRNNKGGIYVGVVVNDSATNWPDDASTAHIRNIHEKLTAWMIGDKANGAPGYAARYGVSIGGVIPISYDPANTLTGIEGTDADGETVIGDIPVAVNDIIVFINDYGEPSKDNGAYINTLAELKDQLDQYFAIGAHLMTAKELKANTAKRLATLDQELEGLEHKKKRLEARLREINSEIAESDAVQGILESAELSQDTAKGRANRKRVSAYFIRRGYEDPLSSTYDADALGQLVREERQELERRQSEAARQQ